MSESDTISDAISAITTELVKALSPLKDILSDTNGFVNFMLELGWQVDDVPQPIENLGPPLQTLVDSLQEIIDGTASNERYIELGKTIIELLCTIKDISNANPNNFLQSLVEDDFLKEFPNQIIDYLLIEYLREYHRLAFTILEALGLIKFEMKDAEGNRPEYLKQQIKWSDFPTLLRNPSIMLESEYGWGTYKFDYLKAFQYLSDLTNVFEGHVYLTELNPQLEQGLGSIPDPTRWCLEIPFIEEDCDIASIELGLGLYPVPGDEVSQLKPGLALLPYATGKVEKSIRINKNFSLLFESALDLTAGIGILKRPGESIEILSDIISTGESQTVPPSKGHLIIGLEYSTTDKKLGGAIRGGVELASDKKPELLCELQVKGANVVIKKPEGDGFLAKILPEDGIKADFDFTLGVSKLRGLYFKGSGGLEIKLPIKLNLGPVEVSCIYLKISIKDSGDLSLELSSAISAKLGPICASIDRMGLSLGLSFLENRESRFGPLPLDLDFAFKPPNGVGLSIDASAVKGGGFLFFDYDRQEYAGALELVFSEWLTLKAIGLITTRMPDGSKGFSLLVIITAEFGSPIQLSFGFTLSGVGGLLGLNRTMNLQPLVEGVRTGAVNNIMFPTDVAINAPRIISDMRTFFPPQKGIFLIGPMAKIGWGTPNLVTLSLGIIIEIPGPKAAILGVLKVELPDEKVPLLVLKVNFVGAVEFDKKRAWFFATMFESRVLFLTIEGEMGLLVAWGDDPNFVVSVGGFHPAFNPPPLPFPQPKRIAISILNKSWAKIRVEGYFAVTSNTVQLGARAELFFGFSAFNINGHIAFDALFQFSPFYFIITISSKLSIKVFGLSLLSVRLRGSLEGPTPWHIEGTGSISILFFDIDVDFSHTWGEESDTSLPPIEVLPLLKAEYEKIENWSAEVPAANTVSVSLRKIETTDDLVLHPVGTLKISQRTVPLDLTIDKVGANKPSDANHFTLSTDTAVGEIEVKDEAKEMFAMAQFKDMDDAKKLSAPAFEKWKSGLELSVKGEQLKTSSAVKRVVRYEQIIIDSNFKRFVKPFFKFFAVLFGFFLNGAAVTKSKLSNNYQKQKLPFIEKITVMPGAYAVAFNTDNSPFNEDTRSFASYAQAEEFMNRKVKENPNLQDSLHVIPQVEMKKAS